MAIRLFPVFFIIFLMIIFCLPKSICFSQPSDYIIPLQLGGTQGIMFGNLIWSQFGIAFNWPFGAALGFVLFVISVTILGLTAKFGSTEGGFLSE